MDQQSRVLWDRRDCFWAGSGEARQQHSFLDEIIQFFNGSLQSAHADSFQMELWGETVHSLCVVGGKALVQGVLWRLHPLLLQLLLQLRQPHVGVLLF